MPTLNMARLMPVATYGLLAVMAAGCCKSKCAYMQPTDPVPQGTYSDQVWMLQETNAEASDFVIHEHEFDGNTSRLNSLGESHVRQVAARMDENCFPVIVEQSSMSKRDGDQHGFPVHGDVTLDQRRREVIVHTLIELGAKDVENKVVVAPALTPGYQLQEAQAAYLRSFSGFSRSNQGRSGSGLGNGGGRGGSF